VRLARGAAIAAVTGAVVGGFLSLPRVRGADYPDWMRAATLVAFLGLFLGVALLGGPPARRWRRRLCRSLLFVGAVGIAVVAASMAFVLRLWGVAPFAAAAIAVVLHVVVAWLEDVAARRRRRPPANGRWVSPLHGGRVVGALVLALVALVVVVRGGEAAATLAWTSFVPILVLALWTQGAHVDRAAGLLRLWRGPFVPVVRRALPLAQIERAHLTERGGPKARHCVVAAGDPAHVVYRTRDRVAARCQAEALARALGVPLADATDPSGEPVVRAPHALDVPVALAPRGAPAPPRPPAPSALVVEPREGGVDIRVPARGVARGEWGAAFGSQVLIALFVVHFALAPTLFATLLDLPGVFVFALGATVGATLWGAFSYHQIWGSLLARAESQRVEVSPRALRVERRRALRPDRVETLPADRIEQVQVKSTWAHPLGGYQVTASSDDAEVSFAHGVSLGEAEWLRDVVEDALRPPGSVYR
jgi:hypothetical protein